MKFKKSIMALALIAALPQVSYSEETAEASSLMEAITESKVYGNIKARYETVNQDNRSETADALTARVLFGVKTKPLAGFSVTAEPYAMGVLVDEYNDLRKGTPDASMANFPVIADSEYYGIHQLFLEYTGLAKTSFKLGRQSATLDNWRFIGDVRFRQNWQVMDGLSMTNKSFDKTTIYLAHYERVKQITNKLREANIEIANVKYDITPTTSLSGYGYFIDWERPLVASSNQTIGVRLDGAFKFDDKWKALYTAEYAKQNDYQDGNPNIDNHYYWLGGGVGYGDWFITLNQELLSGNSKNVAFQTPLGTNHLFQGWSDLFLTTPNSGIQDTFLKAGGKLFGAVIKSEYHWIDGDRNFTTAAGAGTGSQYGTEFDIGIYYKFNKALSGSLEYANFKEDDVASGALRKPDTEKLWLTGIYKF